MTTLPSPGELPEELVAEARELADEHDARMRALYSPCAPERHAVMVELVARALMAERERAAREERERIVALLTAILDVFTRCGIDNDWTALLTTLSAAILKEPQP